MTPVNRGKKYPSEALAPAEVRKLLAACGWSPSGIRNRAALTLMYRGGLRCAEALDVRRCDVEIDDMGRATVRVLRPKGAGRGKPPRVVGLGAHSTIAIKAVLELRDFGPEAPLCCSRYGTRVGTSTMRELLPRLARIAKIKRRVHCHALRHSFAYEMAMEGVPVPMIQKALGHSSLGVTAKYLDHLAPMDVIEGMWKRR